MFEDSEGIAGEAKVEERESFTGYPRDYTAAMLGKEAAKRFPEKAGAMRSQGAGRTMQLRVLTALLDQALMHAGARGACGGVTEAVRRCRAYAAGAREAGNQAGSESAGGAAAEVGAGHGRSRERPYKGAGRDELDSLFTTIAPGRG